MPLLLNPNAPTKLLLTPDGKLTEDVDCCCGGLCETLLDALGRDMDITFAGITNNSCGNCPLYNTTYFAVDDETPNDCCASWYAPNPSRCPALGTSAFDGVRIWAANSGGDDTNDSLWHITGRLGPVISGIPNRASAFWRITGLTAKAAITTLLAGSPVVLPFANVEAADLFSSAVGCNFYAPTGTLPSCIFTGSTATLLLNP